MSLRYSQAKMFSHNKFVLGCNREPKQENRDPAEAHKGGEVLELADSAEETTYIHPASKSRFGSQHKGLRSEQQQQQQQHVNGMTMLVCPCSVHAVLRPCQLAALPTMSAQHMLGMTEPHQSLQAPMKSSG